MTTRGARLGAGVPLSEGLASQQAAAVPHPCLPGATGSRQCAWHLGAGEKHKAAAWQEE